MKNMKLPDDWKKVKLKDITELITKGTTPTTIGYNYINEGVNFVKIESITNNGEFLIDKMTHISEECNNKMIRSQLKENDIVFSIAGAIGRTAMVSKEILPANTNQALAIIRLNTGEVSTEFLLKCLRSEYIFKQFEKKKQGVAQLNLSLKDISELEIIYPSILEQKNIVTILNRAQGAINKKKEAIRLVDELVKSRFVEMFGDPVLNKRNWDRHSLQECCTKITDGTHDTPQRLQKGKLLITGKNIRKDKIDLTEIEYVSEEDHEIIYKRCNPEYGDVLYTNIGVNYGTAVVNNLDYEFSMKNVALLKPDKSRIGGIYLWHYLNLCRSYILEQNKAGGAQTFMSLSTIKSINIFVPSIKLQNQFADFVKQVDKLKFEMQKSLEELENLFNSLMKDAFNGELFN